MFPERINQMERENADDNNNDNKKGNFKWVKYMVYFWCFRLAIFGGGFLVPFFIVGLNETKNMLLRDSNIRVIINQYAPFLSSFKILEPSINNLLDILDNSSGNQIAQHIYSRKEFSSDSIFSVVSDQVVSIYSKFPLHSSDVIESTLEMMIPRYFSSAKYSSSPFFTYSSMSASWSAVVDVVVYEKQEISRFRDFLEKGNSSSYLYHTFLLPSEDVFPLQRALSSQFVELMDLIREKSRQNTRQYGKKTEKADLTRSNLFFSSSGVVVDFHYDMDNNIFLQLFGNKTFIISTPESYSWIESQSFLSPSWRQGKYHLCSEHVSSFRSNSVNITNFPCLFVDFSVSMSSDLLNVNNPILKSKVGRLSVRYAPSDVGNESCSNHNNSSISPFYAWQVDLVPGDVLIIPPFYFHSVITPWSSQSSVSWNLWTPSKVNFLYDKMTKQGSLPFGSRDSLSLKISLFVVMIFRVVKSIREDWSTFVLHALVRSQITPLDPQSRTLADAFQNFSGSSNEIHMLLKRFIDINTDYSFNPICSCQDFINAGQHINVFRSAEQLANTLQSRELFSKRDFHLEIHGKVSSELMAIRRLLLLDYLEETLEVIFQGDLSPEKLQHLYLSCFLSECLGKKNRL